MASTITVKGVCSGSYTAQQEAYAARYASLQSINYYTDASFQQRTAAPDSGTLLVEHSPNGEDWIYFRDGTVDFDRGDKAIELEAVRTRINSVRVTWENISQPLYFIAVFFIDREPGSYFDHRVIERDKAITTQGFSELNSKKGNQFEAAIRISDLLNLTPQVISFKTGNLPVILKQRDVYGGFVNADFEVFKNADISGGTPVNITNNNDLVDNSGGVQITLNPTVNALGSPFGVPTPLLGSEGLGGRIITTFGGEAGEKILAPNTQYVARITNLATTVIALMAVRLYFYEGVISTQRA